MNPRRLVLPLLIVAGLAVYTTCFLAVRLPSVENALSQIASAQAGGGPQVFRRVEFFRYLVLPEKLLDSWCGTPPEFSLLDRLPLLAVATGILGWAAALGWLLLLVLRVEKGLTRRETLVFSIAVGLNAISTLVLAVGLCGWLQSRLVFLMLAATTVAAAAALAWRRRRIAKDPRVATRGLYSQSPSPPSPVPRPPSPGLSSRWLWLAVPFAATIVLGGMLPPVEFDVREYHLQAPKEFYEQGRITFLPHNVYANMPLGMEMLALLGMAITGNWWLGALVGKTLIALMAPLTALGLWSAGRRFFSPAAGVTAAIVYISIPWVLQVSTAGLIDAAMGCYLFLAAYAVLLATTATGRSFTAGPKAQGLQPLGLTVLAGYLAGGAVSCKYPAVLFVVLPLLAWVVVAALLAGGGSLTLTRLRASLGAAVVRSVCFALAVAIGCGLWLAKNWVSTGNPTYPLAYSVFGGKNWDVQKNQQWNAIHLPSNFSARAAGSDLAKVTMTSEWLSPLVMPLALLGLVGWRRGKGTVCAERSAGHCTEDGASPPKSWITWALAGYFAVVIAAWWFCTYRPDRFWIPALPLVALLAGAGACWSTERWWRWTLGSLLVLGVVYCFLASTTIGGGYISYFISLDNARAEVERGIPGHDYLNRTGRQGRVLLVGDAQPFDLRVPVLYNTFVDDSIFEQLVKDRSPEEIRAGFAERGITYVLVNWSEIHRYRETYGMTPFVRSHVFGELVHDGVLQSDQGLEREGRVSPFVAQLFRIVRPSASSAAMNESD